ncbi:DUF2491 family protein [Iodobacter sp. LRB]|uniref:DUF2491 family protein n=1 Tax=unclassified Iodobacter TaxID=235634 RepID=UPI000C0D9A34|nr:DUF2491 family protein [Iodobacter sp. BJB302]PHV03429.1 hypothetical protein CSQ88_01575 [Iodobacter sp. BJB302]
MGWKDAFNYGSKLFAKEEERQDAGLPLGARIGSLITLQMSPFIRASTSGSVIEAPANLSMLIQAVSRVKINLSGHLYRLYIETGNDETPEKFIQVFQNQAGVVEEIMYCTRLTRVFPASAEDQEAFTGEAGYGLGCQSYALAREQFVELGFSGSRIAEIFGGEEQLEYQRDAGSADAEFVPPFTGSEVRIDDAMGVQGLSQKIYFMPYVRQLASGPEYLLISTEVVTSEDGDYSKRAIHVDFMIGLPLELERITVQ